MQIDVEMNDIYPCILALQLVLPLLQHISRNQVFLVNHNIR